MREVSTDVILLQNGRIEIKKNLKIVMSCLFAYVLQLRTKKKKHFTYQP